MEKKCSWKMLFFGILLIVLSVVMKSQDPFNLLVKDQFAIKPGKLLFKVWQKPPIDVFVNAYFFNITNAEEFLSGEHDKLRMSEIGPYTFQEFVEHKNPTFHENGTVTYQIYRYLEPIKTESSADPYKDIVITPNLLLLGASSIASKHSKMAAYGFTALAQGLQAKPILNLTVQQLLWGYEDRMINIAATVLPSMLPNKKFGLLDRMFAEGENFVTMHLPESIERLQKLSSEKKQVETPIQGLSSQKTTSSTVSDVEYEEDYEVTEDESSVNPIEEDNFEKDTKNDEIPLRQFSVDLWNGSPVLPNFENNVQLNGLQSCNKVQGACDASLFPKNIKKTAKFKVYRKAFCRLLPIYFSEEFTLHGLDAYKFELSENAFYDNLDDPDTKCFCVDNKCLRKGLGNISPCSYGLPFAVSQPHFFNADPSLLNEVVGMNPDKDKHQTFCVIQPQLGLGMNGFMRAQINLINENYNFNHNLRKFSNLTVPIMWAEVAVKKLPFHLEILLKVTFGVLPVVQTVLIVVFFIVGISLILLSVLSNFKTEIEVKDVPNQSQVNYPLLKIT